MFVLFKEQLPLCVAVLLIICGLIQPIVLKALELKGIQIKCDSETVRERILCTPQRPVQTIERPRKRTSRTKARAKQRQR
jgi:hypothetical protein